MKEINDIKNLFQMLGNSSETYHDIEKIDPVNGAMARLSMVGSVESRREAAPSPMLVAAKPVEQNASKSELTLIFERLVGADRRNMNGNSMRSHRTTDLH